jgi:hypothetical protein
METAMATLHDVILFSAERTMAFALLIILVLFGIGSKHVLSFLVASLLAAVAFSVVAFSDLERLVVAGGCATGSLLASLIGMHCRRKAIKLRVELERMSARITKLEEAESRRLLDKIRSNDPKLSQPLETGELAKPKDDLGRELPAPGNRVITKIYR